MANTGFLPTSKKEMEALGWEQADIILFTGDAYVDHPSFGAAVIGRVLENAGYRVAIVPQPNWRDDLRDFKKLGEPRLFFAVTSGCMDSMVNHYTANKRLRSDDAYTAGGVAGNRPDYAVRVYSQIIKKLFPHKPLVIGGIEASMRRLTHYDYWSDSLFPSILIHSGADMLVYGMGEKSVVAIAKSLGEGRDISEITDIPQTGYLVNRNNIIVDNESIMLNGFDECLKDTKKFNENFKYIEEESNRLKAKRIIEPNGDKMVVINPPYPPVTTSELDSWYDLPYMRSPHPRYKNKPIPAWEMIKFSINIHRGCFGGCSFCTISAHQGKFVSSRSEKSIVKEIEAVISMPDFKGHLTDLGGPTANMYRMQGIDLGICQQCKRPSCIFPKICGNLNRSHEPLLHLYRKVRNMRGIKKMTIGSGIRYDLFDDQSDSVNRLYAEELIRFHVSGRLKVAPEHSEEEVLKAMRKPSFRLFQAFKDKFDAINGKYSLNQQLIPYFISSHPACTDDHMRRLVNKFRRMKFKPEQVQDFTPTPMTLSTAMFYTGYDPYTGTKMHVARSKEDKLRQKSFFFR